MNTTEIKCKNKINSFEDLYKSAKKQFINYEKIEGIENWKNYDFSIDCSEDQMKFKDMLQIRFIEELTEASHCLDEPEHFLEEITDAMNFLLSAYIMCGYDLNKLEKPKLKERFENKKFNFEEISKWFYLLVHDVGNVCNLLKNRPWTQSNYLVSLYDFDLRMIDLWVHFWSILNELCLSENKLFELFEKKFLVNNWRIKTGY